MIIFQIVFIRDILRNSFKLSHGPMYTLIYLTLNPHQKLSIEENNTSAILLKMLRVLFNGLMFRLLLLGKWMNWGVGSVIDALYVPLSQL